MLRSVPREQRDGSRPHSALRATTPRLSVSAIVSSAAGSVKRSHTEPAIAANRSRFESKRLRPSAEADRFVADVEGEAARFLLGIEPVVEYGPPRLIGRQSELGRELGTGT